MPEPTEHEPAEKDAGLAHLIERAEAIRLEHNAIPWWRTFKRQDAARRYRYALLAAALADPATYATPPGRTTDA